MERFAIDKLCNWKDKENRVPIILCGARGVGKSWILHEFGARFFDNVIYIDFEKNQELKNVFKPSSSVSHMIMALESASGKNISFSQSLVVLDEIEDIPHIMSALAAFKDNVPELAICCSISKSKSYVEDMMLKAGCECEVLPVYPMSYEEFCMAAGNPDDLDTNDMLYKYCLVGGLPEMVNQYIAGQCIDEIHRLHQQKIENIKENVRKSFTKPSAKKILQILDALCLQLSKENKKFMYGQIKKGARAKEYEAAVKYLEDNGYIYRSYRSLEPQNGLRETIDLSTFKIFFYDLGLFMALSDDFCQYNDTIENLLNAGNYAVAEEYSMTQFIAYTDFIPYYYSAEYSKGEISFLFDGKDSIIPVDVMGTENLQAKSLKAFRQKYDTTKAIRLSLSAYEERHWMINVRLNNVKGITELLDISKKTTGLQEPDTQEVDVQKSDEQGHNEINSADKVQIKSDSSQVVIDEITNYVDESWEIQPVIEEAPIIDMPANVDSAVFEDHMKYETNVFDDTTKVDEVILNISQNTGIDDINEVDLEADISEKQIFNTHVPEKEISEEDAFDSDDLDMDDFEIEESSCVIISEEDTESIDFDEPLELGVELESEIDFSSGSDFTSLYTTDDMYTSSYHEDTATLRVEEVKLKSDKNDKDTRMDNENDFAEYVWTEDMIKKYT